MKNCICRVGYGTVPLAIVVYIDGSFVKHKIPLKPIYVTVRNLKYIYRSSHPVLRWLPTKLAEWIGENLQEVLGFPDKGNVRAGPGSGWTAADLNHILQAHVVDGTLTTFGCVEW
jgi:hypothetical protein